LIAKLRSAPHGRLGELELAARRQLVLTFVAMIRTLNAQIKDLERQIRDQVGAHPDGPIFLSLFKSPVSVITAAELLAEIGDCRERYPDRDALAAAAGQAAVAHESGKWKTAGFRRACNKRLRVAFCRLADSSRHWHPWAQAVYAQARQRGHEHPRAIRTLGRAWCRVVWQCWRNHTPYDPARHRALQRHITVAIPTLSGPAPDLVATQRMAGATVTQRAANARARSARQAAAIRYPNQEVDTGRLRRRSARPVRPRRSPIAGSCDGVRNRRDTYVCATELAGVCRPSSAGGVLGWGDCDRRPGRRSRPSRASAWSPLRWRGAHRPERGSDRPDGRLLVVVSRRSAYQLSCSVLLGTRMQASSGAPGDSTSAQERLSRRGRRQTSGFRVAARGTGTAASKHRCLYGMRSLQAREPGRYRSSREAR